ncbi:MAG TPA: tRNA (uridine(54)-C5)-methyltransferase TrmA [Pseudomonadales bacterium]|nr:tRNA (uridine(54)-C5)-methyltransferase TrmA [Pseudomonadales bacterium]
MQTENYSAQLDEKVSRLNTLLLPFSAPTPAVFPSPASHYRMRAEFKFWRDDGDCFYAMTDTDSSIIRIEQFPVACQRINALMPALLAELKQQDALRKKLFQVEFLAATTDDAVITLIYHRQLDETWKALATSLQEKLGCSIIGRSRGKKIVIGCDYVTENFTVDGEVFSQRQPETAFSQPNAVVNQQMLTWAAECTKGIGGDLLELYCGNGNFTLPLSHQFEKVLATEVSKSSVNALQHNVTANHCNNIALARLSSEELTQALNGVRPFRRLAHINLSDYRFTTVLVDPPRAGLDPDTVNLIQRFDHIIYISCNPDTLAANLHSLCDTHTIIRTALFDQFPYTHHMESGILLKRKTLKRKSHEEKTI